MEPVTLVLIFVLVIAITLVVASYYKKKDDEDNKIVNYDILHQLVEAYGPNISIQPKIAGLSYVDFGKDASGNDLNKVANDFLNNVSQKTCKKDSSFEFPVAFSDKNKQIISSNLNNYLQKLSLLTSSMMNKATTKNELSDCKNIMTVLSFMILKSNTDFEGETFIQYFPTTDRINILYVIVKQLLFGNDYEYSPNLMDYASFKELLYNAIYNQSKLENYVNYAVADAKFRNKYMNEYLGDNVKQLESLYNNVCEKDPDDPTACLIPFSDINTNLEEIYNTACEKDPDDTTLCKVPYNNPIEFDENQVAEDATAAFEDLVKNSSC